jgi:c-di-GMP-binding flagellar brake protein YcgR
VKTALAPIPHPPRSRRRHARAELPATAIIFTERRPIGPCLIEDLSEGGLRVVVGSAIRRGRVVSVLLDLPGKQPLLSFAQVTRHERRQKGEHVLALSFLNLPRAEVERLQALVARMLADHHPCFEFFDTEDDGRPKRLVLSDDPPIIG